MTVGGVNLLIEQVGGPPRTPGADGGSWVDQHEVALGEALR